MLLQFFLQEKMVSTLHNCIPRANAPHPFRLEEIAWNECTQGAEMWSIYVVIKIRVIIYIYFAVTSHITFMNGLCRKSYLSRQIFHIYLVLTKVNAYLVIRQNKNFGISAFIVHEKHIV